MPRDIIVFLYSQTIRCTTSSGFRRSRTVIELSKSKPLKRNVFGDFHASARKFLNLNCSQDCVPPQTIKCSAKFTSKALILADVCKASETPPE